LTLSGSDTFTCGKPFIIPSAIQHVGSRTSSSRQRRRKVLIFVICFSNKEIASRVFISNAAVRTHLMHIYEKLHVRCRTETAAKYLRSNPTSPSPKQAGAN
jgi:DNA-binding NarL/FixJ family response regulator